MRHSPPEAPAKIVTFFNDTDIDFIGYWAKSEYHFPPGTRMMMEDWKARHFAKHLADAWCFKNEKENRRKEDFFISKMGSFIIDEGKALASTEGELSKMKTELLAGTVAEYPKESAASIASKLVKEAKFCESCSSKGGRHKKGCPKLKPDVTPVA